MLTNFQPDFCFLVYISISLPPYPPQVDNYFVCCGMNGNAPQACGIGKVLAELIVHGYSSIAANEQVIDVLGVSGGPQLGPPDAERRQSLGQQMLKSCSAPNRTGK